MVVYFGEDYSLVQVFVLVLVLPSSFAMRNGHDGEDGFLFLDNDVYCGH